MGYNLFMIDIYTVYADPLDYPGHYVVRRFESGPLGVIPCEIVAMGKTLGEVRNLLLSGEPPKNLTRINRNPYDDPKIVEIWL